jgi:hypothetical protein
LALPDENRALAGGATKKSFEFVHPPALFQAEFKIQLAPPLRIVRVITIFPPPKMVVFYFNQKYPAILL